MLTEPPKKTAAAKIGRPTIPTPRFTQTRHGVVLARFSKSSIAVA